jgi:hypothetical protein
MLFLPLLLFALLWPFLTGVRHEIMSALILIFLTYYVVREKFPIIPAGLAEIFGLLMFGLMTTLRSRDLRQLADDISFLHLAMTRSAAPTISAASSPSLTLSSSSRGG